jgi:predicted Rossmann fold nucleotide-binding protein DprA/Smf involved in DNA uptake
VEEAELARLAAVLGTGADAVPPLSPDISVSSIGSRRQKVLQVVRRRPCSAEDVAAALGVNYTEAIKVLARMEAEGSLSRKVQEGRIFYSAP